MGVGGINSKFASEIKGLTSMMADMTALTTGAQVIDGLIAIVKPEQTTAHRGYLDQISPEAQRQLMVELIAIRAKIAAWHA